MHPLHSLTLLLSLTILHITSASASPHPYSDPIQPFQIATPSSSPPATIPAFPEQSDLAAGCRLHLPDSLFPSLRSACGHHLHRHQCCPVLAAWLYSAYSSTALTGVFRTGSRLPADLPVLPDDSEACVLGLEKALRRRGVELARPNETCDVVYCYCGVRLHPLSCLEAFRLDENGRVVGDERVERLERDCLGEKELPGMAGCSKCLNSLYKVIT